jgi:Skp family chaperone for outer membrane proteins
MQLVSQAEKPASSPDLHANNNMTTATRVAPDLKQVAAQYRDGLRRLILAIADYPNLQNESVSQFRQKSASLNDQVQMIRSRCGEIQNSKAEFQRLQNELQKRSAEANTAKRNLEALSQRVGEAAFRESLAGRLPEFPALQTRRDLQHRIDELSQEKFQVDQATHAAFTDKAKQVAQTTALSGRVLLLKQKVASADKALGSAVLELKQEETILDHEAILTNVMEARQAIAECEENLTVAKRHLDDCRSHAVAIGISEVDDAHFDAEYKKDAEGLLALECDRLSARWEFGQALISTPPDALPDHLRQLTVDLSRLASEYPEACQQSTVDKATLVADLKEQVSLLHEKAGTIIFKNGLFSDTLSAEASKVADATEQERTALLRKLGKAAFGQPNPMIALKDEPTILAIFTEVSAITLTIKEIAGEALIGTDGKAPPVPLHFILGGIGCLAMVVLMCCGVLTSAVSTNNTEQVKRQEGTQRSPVEEKADVKTTTAAVDVAYKDLGDLRSMGRSFYDNLPFANVEQGEHVTNVEITQEFCPSGVQLLYRHVKFDYLYHTNKATKSASDFEQATSLGLKETQPVHESSSSIKYSVTPGEPTFVYESDDSHLQPLLKITATPGTKWTSMIYGVSNTHQQFTFAKAVKCNGYDCILIHQEVLCDTREHVGRSTYGQTTLQYARWYARGIGLVKEDFYAPSANGDLRNPFLFTTRHLVGTVATAQSESRTIPNAESTHDFSKINYTPVDFTRLDYSKGPNGELIENCLVPDFNSTPTVFQGFVSGENIPAEDAKWRGLRQPELRKAIASKTFVFHGRQTKWNKLNDESWPNAEQDRRDEEQGNQPRIVKFDGRRAWQEHWFNGERHGKRTEWTESGDVTAESYYVRGLKHGHEVHYFSGGQKSLECWFYQGKLHGIANGWHSNGKQRMQITWVDGKRHGRAVWWRDDGQKLEEVEYIHGLLKTQTWNDGNSVTTYTLLEDGKCHQDEYRPLMDGTTGHWRSLVTLPQTESVAEQDMALPPARMKFRFAQQQFMSQRHPLPVVTGRKLEVRINTEDTRDLKNHSFESAQCSACIGNVHCTATAGSLVIDIDMNCDSLNKKVGLNIPFAFVVRLFDDNGNYLTHFSSNESFAVLPGTYDMWNNVVGGRKIHLLNPHGNRLVYGVNKRDLRDASIVEIRCAIAP